MEIQLAVVVGILYWVGVFLLLRRSIVKLVFGLALIGHANNLLILAMGRAVRGHPPIIETSESILTAPYADPLPQALILTAIVIGFAVQAFALILVRKVYLVTGTHDLLQINSTDT